MLNDDDCEQWLTRWFEHDLQDMKRVQTTADTILQKNYENKIDERMNDILTFLSHVLMHTANHFLS
jgi:hypothetical protein